MTLNVPHVPPRSLTLAKRSGTCPVRCPFLYRPIAKRHTITGSRLGHYAETGQPPGFGGGGWGPGRTFPGKFSRSLHKKISRDLFRNEVPLLDSLHEFRVENNGKFTSVFDVMGFRSGPQNRPSFPFDRATYPAPFRFASQ